MFVVWGVYFFCCVIEGGVSLFWVGDNLVTERELGVLVCRCGTRGSVFGGGLVLLWW